MKEKLLTWIDNAASLAVELQTGLTKHPAISPESGGEGELEKCQFLEDWLRAQGITGLERFDAPDARAKGGVRPNLIATIPGSDDSQRLWIMSHLDVVPPGNEDLWNTCPWTVKCEDSPEGKRLYGRGTEDDQQGLVSSVLTALAFVKQGLKPAVTIKLLFASDEELGSVYGIDWLVKNHGSLFKQGDMALVPDGGDPKGENIEIAEKNVLWMKFVTTGKETHGARPNTGKNACLAASDLTLRLHYELSEKFGKRDPLFEPDYSTFQPTKRENNVPNINTIPGSDVFYMDMRILPCYSTDLVLAEVDKIKTSVEEKHSVKIEYTLPQRMESKPTSQDAPVIKLLSAAIAEIYSVQPKPIGIGGGTMAAYLRNIGIDCAVWTKAQGTLHQPNEYALLENILGDAKVFALCAMANEE